MSVKVSVYVTWKVRLPAPYANDELSGIRLRNRVDRLSSSNRIRVVLSNTPISLLASSLRRENNVYTQPFIISVPALEAGLINQLTLLCILKIH